MSAVRVKVCGLTRSGDVEAAVAAGAGYIGFVFFDRSPRNVSPVQAADLASVVPPGICKVALTVDADDRALDRILAAAPIDMIQMHGHESAERVSAVRTRFGLPVMKAVGVAQAEDLAALEVYGAVSDQILVDAKPPRGASLPGGNGVAFDWTLLSGRRWPVPWMLAGGLTADTVRTALRVTGARQVDVSSGVESAPGHKAADLMAAFVNATKEG